MKSFKTSDIYMLKLTRITSIYKNYQVGRTQHERAEELPKGEDLDGLYAGLKCGKNKFTLVTHDNFVVDKDINDDYIYLTKLGEVCIKNRYALSLHTHDKRVKIKTLTKLEDISTKKDLGYPEIDLFV